MDEEKETRGQRFQRRYPFLFAVAAGVLVELCIVGMSCSFGGWSREQQTVEELARRLDFVDAGSSLNEVLESVYAELDVRKRQIETLENNEATMEAIASARSSWESGDHSAALELLKGLAADSAEALEIYVSYSAQYVDEILAQVDVLTGQRDYAGAIALLDASIPLVENPTKLEEKREELSSIESVALNELALSDSRHFELVDVRKIDTVGGSHSPGNLFSATPALGAEYSFGLFYLGGEYRVLTGEIAISDETPQPSGTLERQGTVEIIVRSGSGERKVWESSVLGRGAAPFAIPECDVAGAEWLEIRCYKKDNTISYGVCVLFDGFRLTA